VGAGDVDDRGEPPPWADAERWAADHGYELVGVPAAAVRGVDRHQTRLPRLAVLHTWTRTQDDGWVRYTLDHMGVPFTYLAEDRLAEGGLRERFDVILFPTQGRMQTGPRHLPGDGPALRAAAVHADGETPTHGAPERHRRHDRRDGLRRARGARRLHGARRHAHHPGLRDHPAGGDGLVREVTVADRGQLFVPGSIVGSRVARPRNPLTYGYGESFPVFHQFGPYLNVAARQRGRTVLRVRPGGRRLPERLRLAPGAARRSGRRW
jgi:hypothetical protein